MNARGRPSWWVMPLVGAGTWFAGQLALGADLLTASAGSSAFILVGLPVSYWLGRRRQGG